MSRPRVIIIGAGLAGASTAWHLAGRGVVGKELEVLILERDAFPGRHSSGRNAGMVRQSASREIAPLAVASTRWMREVAGAATTFGFNPAGSILLGDRRRLHDIRDVLLAAGATPDEVEAASPRETRVARLLADDLEKSALVTRTDGVIDALGLLGFFLREATTGGVDLRCRAGVDEVVVEAGRVRGVVVGGELLEAAVVVNAAGGWAGEVAPPGAAAVGITPTARSVFRTGPIAHPAADTAAFVWDIEDEWYFRAESGGWLLCAGEERSHPPGIPAPDLEIEASLREKLTRFAPGLADVPIASSWAGLRTFTGDRLPAIGRDPAIDGLVWMAGLGGHGVTISYAAGARCAAAILDGGDPGENAAFDPARFSRS